MKKIILILLCVILTTAVCPAFGQEVNCKASLDKDKIRANEQAVLSIVFIGKEKMPPPELPIIKGFNSRYINSLDVVVKKDYLPIKSTKHRYSLTPLLTGNILIEPLVFKINGEIFQTEPLSLEVLPAIAQTGAIKQAQPETKDNRVFVLLELQKNSVYLNERIRIQVKFYVNKKRISLTDVEYPVLQYSNFSAGQFLDPVRSQESFAEDYYDVLTFNNTIFATKAGKFKLGPAKIKCNILNKQEKKRIEASGAISDTDFEYVKSPAEFNSDITEIDVMDFPKDNMPQGFKGAVGDFTFDAQVSSKEAQVGGIVNLVMKIGGTSNLDITAAPQIMAGDFKIYQPEIEAKGNVKTFKQILIPEKEGQLTIEKIDFSFFNPETKTYNEISKGPFTVTVFKAQEKTTKPYVPLSTKTAAYSLEEELGKDIVYIKDTPGAVKSKGKYLYDNALFKTGQFLPFLIFVCTFLLKKRSDKLKQDEKYARYVTAFKRAMKKLKKARALFDLGKAEECHKIIFETLKEYLGDKFYMPAAGITIKNIDDIAKGSKLDAEIVSLLKKCFKDHDKAMFVLSEFKNDETIQLFKDVSFVIAAIERQYK